MLKYQISITLLYLKTSDLKFDSEEVTMRRQPFTPQMSIDSNNRLSETSVGSGE